jgi:hypothetical protein
MKAKKSFVEIVQMSLMEEQIRRDAFNAKLAEEKRVGEILGREMGRVSVLLEAALKKRARGLPDATIANHLDISEAELVRIFSSTADK